MKSLISGIVGIICTIILASIYGLVDHVEPEPVEYTCRSCPLIIDAMNDRHAESGSVK